jgi:hypothetical protein
MTTILILGSAPMAVETRTWPRTPFDAIVAINNAHALRPDWDYLVYPWDFPASRLPSPAAGQRLVSEAEFVPAQNAQGGFVYAGGTMAFTAAYWALQALRHALSTKRADALLRHRNRRPAAPRRDLTLD